MYNIPRIIGSISFVLIGFFVMFYVGGMIMLEALQMPIIFAGDYFILGTVVIIVGGIIVFAGFKIAPSSPKQKTQYYKCEFCFMAFEKEVEKINHYLECKKRKNEEPHKEIDGDLKDEDVKPDTLHEKKDIKSSKDKSDNDTKPSARLVYDD